MKTAIGLLSLVLIFASTNALAEGYACVSLTSESKINVINRDGGLKVVTKHLVGYGRPSEVEFDRSQDRLSNTTSLSTSVVDLKNLDQNRKELQIANYELADIRSIILNVDSSQSVAQGDLERSAGILMLVKNNGSRIIFPLTCFSLVRGE